MQFISVAVVFIVGYLSQVYPTSVWWILVSLTGLAALLSGEKYNAKVTVNLIIVFRIAYLFIINITAVCVRPELRRLKIDQASKDQPTEKDKLNGTQ